MLDHFPAIKLTAGDLKLAAARLGAMIGPNAALIFSQRPGLDLAHSRLWAHRWPSSLGSGGRLQGEPET